MTANQVTFDLTPRQIADSIVARIVRPEDCYEGSEIGSELIPALAALRNSEIGQVAFVLKSKFGKDFASGTNQRWWQSIRETRESQRKHDTGESPYILTSSGSYASNLANAITMLSRLEIRFNSFDCKSFLASQSPWGSDGNWTDHDDIKAAEWCQRQGLNVDDRITSKAAESIARDRHPYHPVTEYLSSLEWDGYPRCDQWIVKCMGAADSQFVREVSSKWLIAAVKRVFEPGCQSDYMLVFEGFQGKKKSTSLLTLAGNWFTDDISNIGTPDSAMQLQGNWIVEIAELDAFKRADVTTVNAWLTRRVDKFRPPYGRRVEVFPRQNIFAGTTNKDDWGKDDTGLRRFWPVRVGAIHLDKIIDHRDQIWAEAVHRYRAGEKTYLEADSEDAAKEEQSERQDRDAWEDTVIKWVQSPRFTSMGDGDTKSSPKHAYLPEILHHCLGIPQKDWNPYQKQRVSGILKRAGYRARRVSRSEADESGRRPEVWEPMKG